MKTTSINTTAMSMDTEKSDSKMAENLLVNEFVVRFANTNGTG
mgnify:CR=1 FL=1